MKNKIIILALFFTFVLKAQTILFENFSGNNNEWTIQSKASGSNTWRIYGAGLGAGIYHSQTVQQDEWLITPTLNLKDYSSMYLHFRIRLSSQNIMITLDDSDFFVKVSKDGGANWENIWDETKNNWNSFSPNYRINVSEYVGNSDVKFAFQYINKTPNTSVMVVQIYEVTVSSCPIPSISSVKPLTWENIPEFSGSYDIEYGPRGFNQGEGTLIQGISGNTYNLPEESCNSYDIFIRSNCGNNTSNWSRKWVSDPMDFSSTYSTSIVESNSINFSWESDANEFSLEYGPAGFTSGTGTEITGITSKNYLLEGLNSCTSYSIRVKPSCSSTPYSNTLNFQTKTSLTSPLIPPFSETFDNNNSLCEIGYLSNSSQNLIIENSLAIKNLFNGSFVKTRKVQLTAGKSINFQIQAKKFDTNVTTNGIIKILREGDENFVEEFFVDNPTIEFTNYNFNYTPNITDNYYFSFEFNSNSQISSNSLIYYDNFIVSDVLSTNNFQIGDLIFYPNPISTQINFNQNIIKLEIFDITGKKVKYFEKTDTSFNLEDLKSGIYLIKFITQDGKSLNQKLIKK